MNCIPMAACAVPSFRILPVNRKKRLPLFYRVVRLLHTYPKLFKRMFSEHVKWFLN